MANDEYLRGPDFQNPVEPPTKSEDPNASARAMAWNVTETFDKPGMPKSEADRLTWLQESEVDQREWGALIDDPILFEVFFKLATGLNEF